MIQPAMLAWHFLTIIPLSKSSQVNPSPRDLASSMRWYPVVGAFIGGMLVAGDYIFGQIFSPNIATILLICLLVLVTGGLHQDGIADTIDGLAKRGSIQDRLMVMKDSSIGALGATGLILALLLRLGGMVELPSLDRGYLLLCMPVVGKWAMVVGAFGAKHARGEGGIASDFFAEIQWCDVCWATMWVAVILCGCFGYVVGGIVVVGSAISAKLMAMTFSRVFGGLTGDILGSINEGTEILYLIFCPTLLVFVVSYL